MNSAPTKITFVVQTRLVSDGGFETPWSGEDTFNTFDLAIEFHDTFAQRIQDDTFIPGARPLAVRLAEINTKLDMRILKRSTFDEVLEISERVA